MSLWESEVIFQINKTKYLFIWTCYNWGEFSNPCECAGRKKYCNQRVTVKEDYVDGVLESGETLIKVGEQA